MFKVKPEYCVTAFVFSCWIKNCFVMGGMINMSEMKLPKKLRIIGGGPWFLKKPPFETAHESPLHEMSQKLRKAYKLEKVIEKGETELEKIKMLREWVMVKMVKHGYTFNNLKTKPKDTFEILDCVKQGIRFNCGWHTRVFVQCCEALGYPVRWTNGHIRECDFPGWLLSGSIGHALTEVWSNEYRKWMIMDSTKNLLYEKDGIPLSAAELSIELSIDGGESVRASYGEKRQTFSLSPEDVGEDGKVKGSIFTLEEVKRKREHYGKKHDMGYFEMALVRNRTDYFSNPDAPIKTLFFGPKGVYPPIVFGNKPMKRDTSLWTDDPKVFNWTVNETTVNLKCKDPKKPFPPLAAKFDNNMPNFDHYEVSLDGGTSWKRAGETMDWNLAEGTNTLMARSVNVMDVRGPAAKVDVLYEGP